MELKTHICLQKHLQTVYNKNNAALNAVVKLHYFQRKWKISKKHSSCLKEVLSPHPSGTKNFNTTNHLLKLYQKGKIFRNGSYCLWRQAVQSFLIWSWKRGHNQKNLISSKPSTDAEMQKVDFHDGEGARGYTVDRMSQIWKEKNPWWWWWQQVSASPKLWESIKNLRIEQNVKAGQPKSHFSREQRLRWEFPLSRQF